MTESIEERVAVLETNHETMSDNYHEVRQDIKDIKKNQKQLIELATRGKGVIFGVILTVSVVWSLILGLFGIAKHFTQS